MKSDILELDALVVAREGVELTPPITRRVLPGEILTIRAPNGMGKSSLLATIAGLLRPMAGRVTLGGVPVADHPEYPQAMLYYGHRRGMEMTATVAEHVTFYAKAYRQPELIEAALHYFDLESWADTPIRTLSAGWQQRVALTRLITQPGTVWLLDEPTHHLDEEGMELLSHLIQTRREQKGIILMASHMPLQGEGVQTLDLATTAGGM